MDHIIGCLWALDLNNLSLFWWVTLDKLINLLDSQFLHLKKKMIRNIPHRVAVNAGCM